MLLQIHVTNYINFIALEKCKKECDVVSIILVQGFCPLKITQFPDGFRLKVLDIGTCRDAARSWLLTNFIIMWYLLLLFRILLKLMLQEMTIHRFLQVKTCNNI